MVDIQRESTEYVFLGVAGDEPSGGAEVAFLPFGTRPTAEWSAAILVNAAHELWAEAQSTGVTGDYYLARLIGSFGTGGLELVPDDYQPWARLTSTIEQVVLIAPTTLTIA
ncbi:MAG: hypothetical protein GEU78_09665 [Actinobacteria bacterium]|nr:hypothetical protein [Actinomycetota bacterium]